MSNSLPHRKRVRHFDEPGQAHDPDAKITKMKDGRTHLAHKAEHAVDMKTDANLVAVMKDEKACDELHESVPSEVVADKGFHINAVLEAQCECEIRTYVSEPNRGRRQWKKKTAERDAVYANRRRIPGQRGKQLLRKRGELVERSMAHCYDTGGMRRTHLRGHSNILKRLLVHVAGFNLCLLLRRALGCGTPRGLQGRWACAFVGTVVRRAFRYVTTTLKAAGRRIVFHRTAKLPLAA